MKLTVEITLIYYFIGFVGTRYYEDKTKEGKLYWINENELFDRPMSFEIRNILEHYRDIGYKSSDIYVGAISAIENKPIINWSSLDEWEGITGIRSGNATHPCVDCNFLFNMRGR